VISATLVARTLTVGVLMTSCGSGPQTVRASGITTFDATFVQTPPGEECGSGTTDVVCVGYRVTITNTGTEEGDALCSLKLFDRDGHLVGGFGGPDLVAPSLEPHQSLDITGNMTITSPIDHETSRCEAYDSGALSNLG
jgi:hypothetical protein